MHVHMGICGIGLGHASRSIPVARKLLARGHTITLTAYGEALKLLEREELPAASSIPVSYGLSPDGSVSVKRTILKNFFLPIKFVAQVARETALMESANPSVVYSDTRASTIAAAKALGLPTLTILNQYNIPLEVRRYRLVAEYVEHMMQAPTIMWDRSDIIAVPDLPPPYTISGYTLNVRERTDGKLRYVGPLLTRREISEDELERVRRIFGADSKPLVFIHISGNRPERMRLASKIVSAANKLERYRFIVSLGNPGESGRVERGNVTVFDWIDDVDSLIAACDILVARAGLTVISKAIVYGKTLVAIPTPLHGEQMRNARRVEELGFGKVVDEDELRLAEALDYVSSNGDAERRALELSMIASELDGPSAVADLLEGLAEYI